MNPPNGCAPLLGDCVEAWAVDRLDLELFDKSWFDHRDKNAIPIQTKGTQPWIRNGHHPDGTRSYTRGRWRLWEHDHQNLVENDGDYLWVLYTEDIDDAEPTAHINVVWYKREPAAGITHLLDWNDTRRGDKGRSCRLPWREIVSIDDHNEVDAHR